MAIVLRFSRRIPRLLVRLFLSLPLQWTLIATLAAEDTGIATDYVRYKSALAQLDKDPQAGRRAQAALAALRASTDPHAPIYLGLAQVQWLVRPEAVEEAHAQAQQLFDKTLASIADEAQLPVSLRLELARAEVAVGRAAASLARFDNIGRDHDGLPRVHAAAGAATVYRQQRRYDEALRWIDFALRSLAHHDRYAEYGDLSRYLRSEQEGLKRLRDLLVHGPGFVLYREARVAQLDNRPEDALQRWDRLLQTATQNAGNAGLLERFRADPKAGEALLEQLPIPAIYQEAARFYRHSALAALGRHQQALTGLRRFIADDPTGLYRCEARRLQGDIAFEFQHDPRAATRFYDEAFQAIAAVRALDAQLDLFAVPLESRVRTAPPGRMRGLQGWGNVAWSTPDPAAVINRQTSPWYLDHEELLLVTRRALCRFVTGDREGAVADLDRMLELDAIDRDLTRRNMPSNYLRLRDGFRSGRLFATQAELAQFTGPALLDLVSAEVAYETERWADALAGYDRLLLQFGPRLSEGARAYLTFVRACALINLGRRQEARPLLADFDGPKSRWAKTPTWYRAMIVLGDWEPMAVRIERLKTVAAHVTDPDRRIMAIFKIGQLAYAKGDYTRAGEIFTGLRDQLPENDYRRRAAIGFLDHITTPTRE